MKDVGAEDQQVITAVLEGEAEAYRALVERYQKPIFNLMFRMTGSYTEATDLTQEAFIKAYEKLDKFKTGRKFFPWLYTVSANHAKNFLRKNNKYQATRVDYLENGCLDAAGGSSDRQEDRLAEKIDYRHLYEALGRMPENYREAVVLRYREEMTMRDIAAALKISVSGAKMRVSRGVEKLRKIMKRDSHEQETS
ncbi:MAG: RNA polymerase sigma factor [Desulfobacterales bacterium]|nr:RNA polymerase sigma factor [Desulfobacterales bacterium]